MKWRNHICNGFQSSADPSALLQSKNIAPHILANKQPEEQCLTRPHQKEIPPKTSLYPSIAFPLSNTTSKRTSQPPLLTTKLFISFSLTAFLSWLRLSIYMAIVSIAILLSFHLKLQPSALEKQFALPLGIIFWLLALACLLSGLNNYIKTVNRYSRREALVQSGWGTQVVFTVVASAIVAACVLFLSTQAGNARE